ncbi:MAG: hypothetical protein U0R19_35245 [Bryobacteraceae bacterium]
MAGRQPRRQHRRSQLHRIAVLKRTIHLCAPEVRKGRVAVEEAGSAAILHYGNIGLHHHAAGAYAFPNQCASGHVIPMGMADQKDLDVHETEAECARQLIIGTEDSSPALIRTCLLQ